MNIFSYNRGGFISQDISKEVIRRLNKSSDNPRINICGGVQHSKINCYEDRIMVDTELRNPILVGPRSIKYNKDVFKKTKFEKDALKKVSFKKKFGTNGFGIKPEFPVKLIIYFKKGKNHKTTESYNVLPSEIPNIIGRIGSENILKQYIR